MFINLSNHPSDQWSESQLKAARIYGTILDLPFPNITPTDSCENVYALAEDYLIKIKELNTGVVHVMGELTFSFALVSLLQKNGIQCMASTSERIVEVMDGKKIITFNFVQFRSYSKL